MNKNALIAMSGGVDSSVAALIMKEKGYTCKGATMKLYDNEDIGISREKTCCSLDDVEDARSVAYRLDMPYYVFNFKDEFEKQVIDRFICAYESGATPNPCIDCNRFLKFEKMFERARDLECDTIVTGHYARIEKDEASGRFMLKKAVDITKDQSYVLYSLTQKQLAHVLFPLGTYTKAEIREIAEKNGFINAKKRDSQDICFVPDGDYGKFIEHHTGKTFPQGDFVDKDGNVLGQHKGIIRYTIGQRKGLGLALKAPGYVCKKCMETNRVVIGSNSDLFTRSLIAEDFNWIAYDAPNVPVRVKAKTRYRQTEQWATAEVLENGRVKIVFDEPQRAITKGQAAVLYNGDIVVGGGTIAETEEM